MTGARVHLRKGGIAAVQRRRAGRAADTQGARGDRRGRDRSDMSDSVLTEAQLSGRTTASPKLGDPSLYINRELSWLDFNERVLELAEDRAPAAARAPEVPRDLHLEPRRVLHGAGRRRARADRGARRPPLRRRTHPLAADGGDRHARCARSTGATPASSATWSGRRWPAEGIRIVSCDESGASPEQLKQLTSSSTSSRC